MPDQDRSDTRTLPDRLRDLRDVTDSLPHIALLHEAADEIERLQQTATLTEAPDLTRRTSSDYQVVNRTTRGIAFDVGVSSPNAIDRAWEMLDRLGPDYQLVQVDHEWYETPAIVLTRQAVSP